MISVYADGSSNGRSNSPGGFGWVVLKNGVPVYAGYGKSTSTTNNRMEAQGMLEGLRAVEATGLHAGGMELVELVSDSQWVLGCANGSMNATKNLDIIEPLKELTAKLRARTRWVRGHSGDIFNERCDSLANMGKREAMADIVAGAADVK
jgi:ribonuclease HI